MTKRTEDGGYIFNLVVIVIIVVSFIITGCITIALANWNMKRTEKDVQSNYYSAEMALNDIKAGVEEDCSKDIENAYSIITSSMNTIPYDSLNDEFKNLYTDNLKKRYSTSIIRSKLISYLNSSFLVENQGYGVEFVSEPELDLTYLDSNKVFIRNIGVSYKSANDVYLSRIFTDIEISIPLIYDGIKVSNSANDFTKYALIADKGIAFNGDTTIEGSVYAGDDGITLGEQGVASCDFTSNKVVTRGDIRIFRQSSLNISDFSNKNAQVYAKNLVITREGTHSDFSNGSVAANIKADLFIEEDTLLNAKNGGIVLSGNYYGYHSGTSAFCINGVGITADLSNVKTLWIAGTSYIDIETIDSRADILMGESLTYKGTQSIYLVPSVCIKDVDTGKSLSNPLSISYTTNGKLDTSKCKIDISENKKNGGIDLEKYLDLNNPYKLVFVNRNGVSGKVYLYLNFNSDDLASDYSEDYTNIFKDYMLDRAKSFKLGNIILSPNTSLRTVGNVVTYNGAKVNIKKNVMSSSDDFVSYKDSYFTNKCNSLVSTLQENKTVDKNSSLFDYLINRKAIEDGVHNTIPVNDVFMCDKVVYYNSDVNNFKVLIADGNVKIRNNFDGLVITTGDVEVTSGVAVVGTIISGGSIKVNSNFCKFSVSLNDRYPILYLLYDWTNSVNISKYFNTVSTTSSNSDLDNVDICSLVKYRNWVVE